MKTLIFFLLFCSLTSFSVAQLVPRHIDTESNADLDLNQDKYFIINDNVIESSVLKTALTPQSGLTECQQQGLNCLTDGFRDFSYSFSFDQALKLGFVIGSMSSEAYQKLFIHDLLFYKIVRDSKGIDSIIYGSGIRLKVAAKQIKGSVDISGLASLAASTELGLVQTEYTIETIGLSGPKVIDAIPTAGSYNIEKHIELLKSIDKIKEAIKESTTVVTPQLISVAIQKTDNEQALISKNIATYHAIRGISEGWGYSKLINKLENGVSDAYKNYIKSIYVEFLKTEQIEDINKIDKLRAQQLLEYFD